MLTTKTKKPGKVYKSVLKEMKEYEIVEKETEADSAEGRLRCPKKDCQGEFVVNRKQWKAHGSAGRACPYCFRASKVPGRRYAEEIHGIV